MRQKVYDACAGYKCATAAQTLISIISGDGFFENCDLLTTLQDGYLTGAAPFYQGWRDQFAKLSAFALDLSLIALSV